MTYAFELCLSVSNRQVKQIEVLYPSGQRQIAWILCRQVLPQLEKMERLLGEPEENPNKSTI